MNFLYDKILRCGDYVPVHQMEANIPISLLQAKEPRRAKSKAITNVVTCIKSKHLCLDSDALVQLTEIYFTCWVIEPQFLWHAVSWKNGRNRSHSTRVKHHVTCAAYFFQRNSNKISKQFVVRNVRSLFGRFLRYFCSTCKANHIPFYLHPKPLHLNSIFS